MRRAVSHSAAAVAAALCLLIVGGAEAASSGRPLIARSKMLSVDEVRPGMKGTGKSVFSGTRIESFGVTVLGVLRRVDFGGDIIVVSIDSGPPVAKGFGVVSGMSGSPVYIKGKLVGALAYTWSFAKRPIAGVTPIEQMLEEFEPGSSPVQGGGRLKATEPFLIDGERIDRGVISASTSGGRPAAGSGAMALAPVATPVLVSGLGAGAMAVLRGALEPLGLTPIAGSGAMDHIAARMEPGAAVGARLVGGDLDVTAVGTVTYVQDDVVLAFGHTMSSLGSTDVPLVAAYVHGVMPSAELSFKLASGGQVLGRFTEDRPSCLGGRLGGAPPLVETKVRVSDRDRGVVRSYELGVVRSRSLTSALLTAAMVGAIESVGPPSEGTTRVAFSLEAEGLPRLTRENTYAMEEGGGLLALLLGPSAAVASATEELNRILDVLQNSEFGEAKVSRLDVAVELSKRRRVARLEQVVVDKHVVKPGEEVEITATLRVADAGRETRVERVRIPPSCPPGRIRIGIAGGRSAEWLRSRLEITDPTPESMAQMVQQMLNRPSNDELVVQLALPTVGIEARGHVLRDLPPAVMHVLRSSTGTRLTPLRDYAEQRQRTEWVVSGYAAVSLTVEGDEKDKGGRPPSPQYGPSMFEEMPPGLAGLFSTFGVSVRAATGLPVASGGEEAAVGDGPEMPSWEDVSAVGEGEMSDTGPSRGTAASGGDRGDAIGRVASIWRLAEERELARGERDGVAVMSTGGLALAPQATVMSSIRAQCVWPIAVGPDGAVYTGSWADGRLRMTTPQGDTTVVLETEDAAIQAIAVGQDGTVYAGAVPSGTIHVLAPGEAPRVLCRLDAPDIWALAAGEGGTVWAATGPEGKLFRVSPDGTASVAFTAADRHITALALGADGTAYLATAPRGKVYAVGRDGAARSVFEIEKASAQSIAVDGDGNVYVGTSPDGRVLKIGVDGVTTQLLKTGGRHVLALHVDRSGVVYAAAGPEAGVYAVWPNREWAEIYSAKSAFIAGMAADESGAIYVTAADTGEIVKLDLAGQRSGRFTSPVRDAGARARWGAVRWQGTCPEGAAVSVWTRSGDTGYPDSTWGDWRAVSAGDRAAAGDSARRYLQCRVDLAGSGSAAPRLEAMEVSYLPVNRPPEVSLSAPKGGEIWSGTQTVRWSGRDADGDTLAYEVYWSGDDGHTWTSVGEAVGAEGKQSEGAEAAGAEEKAAPGPETGGKAQETPPTGTGTTGGQQQGASGTGVRAMDEDGGGRARVPAAMFDDALMEADESANLDAGAEPGGMGEEEQQAESEEETTRPSPTAAVAATRLKWDTKTVSDGICRIKVVASDSAANPMDPRRAEAVSRSLTVDNTPPEVIVDRGRERDAPPPRTVSVFDRTTFIRSAAFRVDGGDWMAAVAADGLFDRQFEEIMLDEARLPEGAHEVEVRCRDAAGNTASVTLQYKR